MQARISGRPPGPRRDGGTIFLYLFLALIIAGAFIITGGSSPVDPNSSQGPPTLPPYYDPRSENITQALVLPTDLLTPNPKENLQLKTFSINTCVNNVAINFLVDTSGSFAYDNKLQNLKNALLSFNNRMADLTVIGMQSFSARVQERVPLDYYKNQQVQLEYTIENLTPGGNTRTRDGFKLAQQLIMNAKNENTFPGYKYVLVLLTDGIPELNPTQQRTCIGPQVADPLTAPALRCFAREQDPRYPNNIATELKNEGVSIFSIGIYSPNRLSDRTLQPQLESLLQEVASNPTSDHYYSSVHGGNLEEVLDSIFKLICQ